MTFTPYDPNADTSGGDATFDPPADGKHKGCTLTDTWAGTSNSGNDGALLKFRTPADYEWTVWLGFKSDTQSAITWSQIGKLGIDVVGIDSLDQLANALKECRGTFYDVTVKTSDDGRFRNTNVDGLSLGNNPGAQAQTTVGATAGAAANGTDTSDIPF